MLKPSSEAPWWRWPTEAWIPIYCYIFYRFFCIFFFFLCKIFCTELITANIPSLSGPYDLAKHQDYFFFASIYEKLSSDGLSAVLCLSVCPSIELFSSSTLQVRTTSYLLTSSSSVLVNMHLFGLHLLCFESLLCLQHIQLLTVWFCLAAHFLCLHQNQLFVPARVCVFDFVSFSCSSFHQLGCDQQLCCVWHLSATILARQAFKIQRVKDKNI